MSLRALDLTPAFEASWITPDLPVVVFARRETRQYPLEIVPPALKLEGYDAELPPLGSVLGKYRLERLIGTGGFGAVFAARHLILNTGVALKLLRPSVLRSRPRFLSLLSVEARFAAAIDHPNVVRVHDVSDDAQPYIVMELVDGQDLAVLIRRRGALPHKMVIRIIHHVALGLRAGLEKELVHRDVKPSNILLTRAGITKLADFGLARSGIDGGSGIRGLVGTAAYMAPEVTSRHSDGDFRSDMYSLGVTAFQAITGRYPTFEHGVAIRASKLVPEISVALDDLLVPTPPD